jgi:hypothetical protein
VSPPFPSGKRSAEYTKAKLLVQQVFAKPAQNHESNPESRAFKGQTAIKVAASEIERRKGATPRYIVDGKGFSMQHF